MAPARARVDAGSLRESSGEAELVNLRNEANKFSKEITKQIRRLRKK
jgi:hypothetical protein